MAWQMRGCRDCRTDDARFDLLAVSYGLSQSRRSGQTFEWIFVFVPSSVGPVADPVALFGAFPA
jgi:hypothetical protein